MKPSAALANHRAAVRAIAARHRIGGLRVFGSVLRGDDTEHSDLDILVEPSEETTLLDIGAIQVEVSGLLGCEVDVLTPGALPARWRDRVLKEAEPV
jgi:hypothetical protein